MEKNTNNHTIENNQDLDKLYSFLSILKIVSKTDNFRSWLREYHHLESDEHLFKGYQFFVDVVISNIIDGVEINHAFGLEEDYTLFRAGFHGMMLDDIPTSCEKTRLLKNLWFHYRSLRKCQNYRQISKRLNKKNEPVFSIFDSIFNSSIFSPNGITVEQILLKETILNALVYLNDTSRGRPNAYPGPLISSFVDENNYCQVFPGYLYTLQYLWYNLLNREDFLKSSISQMHNAVELFDFEDTEEDYLQDFDPVEKEVYFNWQALDSFFAKINKEIVEKKEYKCYPGLLFKKEFSNSCLNTLMNLVKIQEPKFLKFYSNRADLEKRLDSFFYWHDIDVLDTNKIHVFNGASAFISVLIGEVEKYGIFHIEDTVIVARIKHPVSYKKNDLSYAILLRSGGIITDTSGWLIFLDCGTDYSGTGGYLTHQIETFLTKYERDKKIQIQEISISSDDFLQYLKQKRLPSKIRDIQNETDEIIRLTGIDTTQFLFYQEIKNLEGLDLKKISELIEKIVFFLRIIIPDKPEHSLIIQKLQNISNLNEISDKLESISSILPFIPQIVTNENIQRIESRLDEIEIKIRPTLSGKFIVTSGVEFMGTGIKYEVEMPLANADYSEMIKLTRKGSIKIKEIPEKIKGLLLPKF